MTIFICLMQMIIFTAFASKKSKQKQYEYLNETILLIVLTIFVSLISICILIFIILACLHQCGFKFIRQENFNKNEIQQEQQMIVMIPSIEKQQYNQFLQDVNQTLDISRLSNNQC
ncbi:unnamed protein product [Paramecium primaurelia]|uniref:Transmembrane protein n=1 Tax=Paramecium primaurelia TaxID=5886 RepID=A0A8S1PAR1_PARPR|nr:unnamed protein product [Paramecium primaurelia]